MSAQNKNTDDKNQQWLTAEDTSAIAEETRFTNENDTPIGAFEYTGSNDGVMPDAIKDVLNADPSTLKPAEIDYDVVGYMEPYFKETYGDKWEPKYQKYKELYVLYYNAQLNFADSEKSAEELVEIAENLTPEQRQIYEKLASTIALSITSEQLKLGGPDMTGPDSIDSHIDYWNGRAEKEFHNKITAFIQARQNAQFMYLVRGAKLTCVNAAGGTQCSHIRRLNLPFSHGVYMGDKPLIHEGDCVANVNVMPFGHCQSPTPPPGSVSLINYTPVDASGNFLGKPNTGTSVGAPCTPKITSLKWYNTNPYSKIAINGAAERLPKGSENYQKMVTTNSFLYCEYGGFIVPVSSGQENDSQVNSVYAPVNADGEPCPYAFGTTVYNSWCKENDCCPFYPGTDEYFSYYKDCLLEIRDSLPEKANLPSLGEGGFSDEVSPDTLDYFYWMEQTKNLYNTSDRVYDRMLGEMLQEYGSFEKIPPNELTSLEEIRGIQISMEKYSLSQDFRYQNCDLEADFREHIVQYGSYDGAKNDGSDEIREVIESLEQY